MTRQTRVCAALIAVGFVVFPSFSANAQSAAPKAHDDVVVAKVEGQIIRRSEVVRAFSTLPQQMQKAGFETIYPGLLERLIQQRLLILEGRKNKLAESAEVKSRLVRLEDALIGEVYLNNLIEQNVTPGLLEQRYADFLKKNPPVDEVRARHILLKTEIDAKNVIGHLDAGKTFPTRRRNFRPDRARRTVAI